MRQWTFDSQVDRAGTLASETVVVCGRTLDEAEERVRRVNSTQRQVDTVRLILVDVHDLCCCGDGYVCGNHRTPELV